jgi:hypothetical protein
LFWKEGALHGRASDGAQTVELTDVRVDGQRVTWAQSITKPIRLNLHFDVTVDGDHLAGTSKAGRLPASTVVGQRVPMP